MCAIWGINYTPVHAVIIIIIIIIIIISYLVHLPLYESELYESYFPEQMALGYIWMHYNESYNAVALKSVGRK